MSWLESVDLALFRFINVRLSNPVFDAILPQFADNGWFVPAIVALAVWLLFKGGARGRLLVLLLILLLAFGDSVVINPLKKGANRPRPHTAVPEAILRVGEGGSGSMPSSHTSTWCAAALIAFAGYRRSWRFMAPLALTVGFSRVYVGAHYPGDVLAGALLGLGYAAAGLWALDSLWRFAGRGWFPLWWSRVPSLVNPGNAGAQPRDDSHEPGCSGAGFQPAAGASSPRSDRGQDARPDRLEACPTPPREPRIAELQWIRFGYLLIAALFIGRLIYIGAGRIELSEDEAYQWLWSKHLAFSYYSKPPMIAFAQFVGTSIWGDREIGVRFLSPVISALLSVLLLRFMAREVSAVAGFWTVAICAVAPLTAVGSTLMTVDPLLVLFWTSAMIVGWRAVQPAGTTRQWIATGLLMGLGFLSKYTAVIQIGCFALFFLLWKPSRVHLRKSGPWLALSVFVLCLLPVIIWNAQHDWITVQHVGENAKLDKPWKPTVRYFFEFLGAEAGLLNPIFFVAALWAAFALWPGRLPRPDYDPAPATTGRTPSPPSEGGEGWGAEGRRTEEAPLSPLVPRGEREKPDAKSGYARPLLLYFFAMGAPVFFGYWLYSLHSRILPNWIAAAVVPMFCLAVAYWHGRWQQGVRAVGGWLSAGMIAGIVIVVICHDTGLIHKLTKRRLPPKMDPHRRVDGWKETAQAVGAARRQLLNDGKEVFIIGSHYGLTGQITFYLPEARRGLPDNPLVYYRTSDKPRNQFYFWPGYRERHKGANAIYVDEAKLPRLKREWVRDWLAGRKDIYEPDNSPPDKVPKEVLEEFESVAYLGTQDITVRGRVLRRVQLHACRNLLR